MSYFNELVKLCREDDQPVPAARLREKRRKKPEPHVVLELKVSPFETSMELKVDAAPEGELDFLPGVARQISGTTEFSHRRSLDEMAQGVLTDLARRGMKVEQPQRVKR